MSEYYAATETVRGIKVKNVEVFKKDLETLEEMFGHQVLAGWEVDYHQEEPFIFLNGEEGATLQPECDEWSEWYERLPPADWNEGQCQAHADAFGYLYYHAELASGDSTEVNLLAFLRHHMAEDAPPAVIHGVSHEGYSTWAWAVAFTHDREEWMGTDDVIKQLEDKCKEPKAP